jgi:tRNA isopentenyl-2-thiomethyl-A-37 hydroxylase MiaE
MDKKIKPDNPYAHPIGFLTNGTTTEWHYGMTLRDHFAGLAMQAAVTALNMKEKYESSNELIEILELIPRNAYWIADRMLEQREI